MNKVHSPYALSQALAETSTRSILEYLRFGQKTVSEIVNETGLKQPNVSNHLAKMRELGIVRAERSGRSMFYSLADPVADALMRLHEFTADSLEMSDAASSFLSSLSSSSIRSGINENNSENALAISRWQVSFVDCLLSGKEDRTSVLVNAMLESRVSLEAIYTNVFQTALHEIGRMYSAGNIDEAQEHLASEITERMMSRVSQFYSPVHRSHYRAVLGCVADNWHALGLRMISDSLKTSGWETLFLGANVPTQSFARMADTMRPHLVVISCSMAEQLAELETLVYSLREAQDLDEGLRFRIIVGGSFISRSSDELSRLPVDLFAMDLNHFNAELPNQLKLGGFPSS